MLAPVLIDLGPSVSEAALQIVLDACNEAIQNGVCLPNALGGSEAPRALAIARPRNASARLVRIEVRLRWQEETSWLVRELAFEVGDPLPERWRSVGLAIATLVGEGERQREAELPGTAPPDEKPPETEPGEPELAAPAQLAPAQPAPAPKAAPAPRARPAEARPEPPEPAGDAPSRRAAPNTDADADIDGATDTVPGPRRSSIFLGVGVLAGPGFGPGPWRLGGTLRASWQTRSGWELASSVGYAARAADRGFSASWLSLAAGVGYRLPLSEQFSSGIALLGGARRARFEALAGGARDAEVLYDPTLALGVDADWAGSSGLGAWVALRAETSGRKSRLFLTPERTVTSPPVDFSGAIGLGWRLP